jgi:hypothetical protein
MPLSPQSHPTATQDSIPKWNPPILGNLNINLTNYRQNAYLWTFLTFSYKEKSKNATQNRGEKYNIYLTNFGQNSAFWTFFETTRISAVLKGRRDSKNRNIILFLFFSRQ